MRARQPKEEHTELESATVNANFRNGESSRRFIIWWGLFYTDLFMRAGSESLETKSGLHAAHVPHFEGFGTSCGCRNDSDNEVAISRFGSGAEITNFSFSPQHVAN